MFLSKNDYLLSDGQNTNICRTKRACVRVTRVGRWLGFSSIPIPLYIYKGWGMGIGALRWESLIAVCISSRLLVLYQIAVQYGFVISLAECTLAARYILVIPFLQLGVSMG